MGPISGISVGDEGRSEGNTAFKSGGLLSAMDGQTKSHRNKIMSCAKKLTGINLLNWTVMLIPKYTLNLVYIMFKNTHTHMTNEHI